MKIVSVPITALAALTLAAPAYADVPGIGPFAGGWGAHNHSLTISADGTGQTSWPDFKKCPSCSQADVPHATANFVLTSVSGSSATGNVTGLSDPQDSTVHVGDAVTATLKPGLQGKGQVLELQTGSSDWEFCNNTSIGQCGA